MRTLNQAGRFILVEREGLYLEAYLCQAKKWTLGIGSTYWPDGVPVKKGDKCTLREAEFMLNFELKEKAESIERWDAKFDYKLNDNQFSALLSFAYNCGTGYLSNPDTEFCQAILSRNDERIRKAFMAFNKYTDSVMGIKIKRVSKGLTIRRKMEADLFFKKDS